jgi:hypothetical protein
MGINAFTKTGNTVTFLANTTAPTPVQAVSSTLGGNQYRIINAGSVTVFLGYGTDGASANGNAAIITSYRHIYSTLTRHRRDSCLLSPALISQVSQQQVMLLFTCDMLVMAS